MFINVYMYWLLLSHVKMTSRHPHMCNTKKNVFVACGTRTVHVACVCVCVCAHNDDDDDT